MGIAVLINVLFIGAYIWSRGGQTTEVAVSVADNNAGVAVDGKIAAIAAEVVGAPVAGGIILALSDTTTLPSLPSPRGIAWVRVTDDAGTLLFEDDFSDGLAADWKISGGIFDDGGLLGSHGAGQLALTDRTWRNYTVTVQYKNVQSAQIVVRARRNLYGIVATVRPFHWNEDVSKWASIGTGRPGSSTFGRDVELDSRESLKSMLAMLTRPYPYILLLLFIGLLAVAALQILGRPTFVWPAVQSRYVAGGIALVVLAVTLYFNVADRAHMPYVPDSVAYIFQAKIFVSGHLTVDPPPVQGAFDFFVPAPFSLTETTWAAQYPFGHPMMLAFGEVFGAPWLIPPLLAAASAALMFVVGRQVYNQRVAIIAAVLLATSPFFIMNASNFMSHNTAGFFLLASLAALTAGSRRPLVFGALAGLAFGLLLNTRPLTAMALTPPFGLYLLYGLLPQEGRRAGLLRLSAFVGAAAVMALLFLGWNYTITGDAFRTGYQATGVTFFDTPSLSGPAPMETGVGAAFGAGGDHQLATGIQNERIQLALLLLVLHGWPQFIGLAFSTLPFLLGSRKLHDWFFLACGLAAAAVWVRYESTGVMYGPRYWYEAMPFLILLAARGADRAADLLASAVATVRGQDLHVAERPLWAGRGAVFGLVTVLVAISVYGWLLGNRTTWQADLVPNSASTMCCVLGVDDRIHRLADEQDLHDALVLVDPCDNNFVCYGSVFWRNDPSLDGDIVYAKDIFDKREEIIAAYPGRDVYLARYFVNGEVDDGTARLELLRRGTTTVVNR